MIFLLSQDAFAASGTHGQLLDSKLELRAELIFQQLRCPVSQDETIGASNTSLASDLRTVIREQVKEGRTSNEVLSWMVTRYGEAIIVRPELQITAIFSYMSATFILLIASVEICLKNKPLYSIWFY